MVARGAAARVLARRLLARDDASLAKLEGISAGEWLVFRGAAPDLPWADGAIYLGRDAAAPALLLPTLWHSAPDAALLQRALQTRFHNRAPLAIVPPNAHRDTVKNPDDASVESLAKKAENNVISSGAGLRAQSRNLDVEARKDVSASLDTTPLQVDSKDDTQSSDTPSQELNSAASESESAPRNAHDVRASEPFFDLPLPPATRVLAAVPTLVFSLENARRLARAPLETWLRAQGEEAPAALSENDARLPEKSPIGDLRSEDAKHVEEAPDAPSAEER